MGFGLAVRTIGFILLVTQIAAICLLKPRLEPTAARALVDLAALQEPSFILLFPVATISYAAVYIPLVYLPSFGIDYHLIDLNLGFYLVSIINAATIPGWLTPPMIDLKFTGIVRGQVSRRLELGLRFDCKRLHEERLTRSVDRLSIYT